MDWYSSDTSDLKTKLSAFRRLSILRRVELLLTVFSPGERLLLYILTIAICISTLALLAGANEAVSVSVPAAGGAIVEGEVGPARFINPLLTSSQADEDITELVYSGLMRTLPSGDIVPDLASSYTVSPDGTTYTFAIRPDATFQDGTPVTATDVVFTIQSAQDPALKSVHRADWDGVAVSAPDARTVVFTLPHAYAPFLENTTLGILPAHLWKGIAPEEFAYSPLNTHPIGSGPYAVSDVVTDNTGSATRYELTPFAHFALGAPYLKKITFLFYPNDAAIVKALNARQIDAVAGISASDLANVKRTDLDIMRVPLPRTFGVFFNQSHATVLADTSVRSALDAAIDKNLLVNEVLGGNGFPLNSPIPPGVMQTAAVSSGISHASSSVAYTDASIASAKSQLSAGGWSFDDASGTWKNSKKQELSFSLATADSPELVATANALADAWRAAGVRVTVQIYPLSELNESVIRPRQYDAILFGEVVGRELDLFAFWHSSQRNDPGLNLALYASSQADTLLSQARATTDEKTREKLYSQFATLIEKDKPAVFLFAPEFIYAVPKGVHGIELGALTTPAERFLNVYGWYTDTERVWNIFARSQ
jgi:peptide/nickel transport system substrate-binding protein